MNEEESTFKDMSRAILDRVGNPISGTFIITWLLTNWRVPVVLFFGSVPEKDRIALIEEIFPGPIQTTILHVVIFPLFFSVIYLVGMPWLKEIYASWLNRHDYRTKRNQQRMIEDLREEGEYRETLRSICAVLKQELREAEGAFQSIKDLSISGLDESKGNFYSQIEHTASTQQKQISKVSKSIEHFFNNYTSDVPDAYQWFLVKWVRTLKSLSGVTSKKE